MLECNHKHHLQYLVRSDGQEYCLQVMGLRGVIASGRDLDKLKEDIKVLTKSYFIMDEDAHRKVINKEIKNSLPSIGYGDINAIEDFTVQCEIGPDARV